jgi:hypothetical protein
MHSSVSSKFGTSAGYVTRFGVRREFLSKYPTKTVGAQSVHEVYWIPAEDLDAFNKNIVGMIEVVCEFQPAQEEAGAS